MSEIEKHIKDNTNRKLITGGADERELKDMVALLGDKAKNADRVKDQRIRDLEKKCKNTLANETKMEKQVRDLKEQVRKQKALREEPESDQEFLIRRKILDAKRKNKLLKAAIKWMQQAGYGDVCSKYL